MSLPAHFHVDRAVNALKWPAAFGSMLVLMPAFATLVEAVKPFWLNHNRGIAFLAGAALFALPVLLRRRIPSLGFWATFEHEMTHILFALLTLHPVRSIQATDGNGGVMSYSGSGNWLVTISPYFFPTVPLVAGIIAMLLPSSLRPFGIAAVGFSLAWHLAATLRETHPGQTDLQKVGFPFALAFLPGITLLCLGFVLALAYRGAYGPEWFWLRLSSNFAKALPW
ncbi:M50 family metallopeptidase [Magnetospirillum sp. 15-1]|uniref:M50 family metallopeptidase n=1 Tax=Magnetospirillum sp. 15-1 TaxID=1979370 RepID=UPI000BBB765A|nr:M50 family metallopeptidase [Magnetospirillum sp. 15-1]